MRVYAVLGVLVLMFAVWNVPAYSTQKTEHYSGTVTGWSGNKGKIRYSFNAGGGGTVIARLRFAPGNNAYLAGSDANLGNKVEQKNRSGFHEIRFHTDGGQFGITIGLDQSHGSSNYNLEIIYPDASLRKEGFSGTVTGWRGNKGKIRYSFNANGSGTVVARLHYASGNNAYLAGSDSNLNNKVEQKNRSGFHEIRFYTDGGQFGITIGLDQSDGACQYRLDIEYP